MVIVLLWLACANEPKPLVSEPLPVGAAPPPQPTTSPPRWASLHGFFPPSPGVPASISPLRLGAPVAELDASLAAVALRGTKPHREVADGREVWIVSLNEYPVASVAVILDAKGETVEQLQLTLPAAEAEASLIDLWGPPAGVDLFAEQTGAYVWASSGTQYTWKTVLNGEKGLLKIESATDR